MRNSLTNSGGTVPVTVNSALGSTSTEGVCGFPAGYVFGTANVGACSVTTLASRYISGGSLVALGSASPRTWYLSATFDDGGQAIGTFVVDASTHQYAKVDISTTLGSTRTAGFPGCPSCSDRLNSTVYADSNNNVSTVAFATANPATTGSGILFLVLTSLLTNADTTVSINGSQSFEGTCIDSACNTAGTSRLVISGSVTSVRPQNYTLILPVVTAFPGNTSVEYMINNLTDSPATIS